MRTTLSIDGELLASAKKRAAERGTTLGQVVEDALRLALSRSALPAARPSVPAFDGGSGPLPGVDLTSNRALYEVLDEGVAPLDRR